MQDETSVRRRFARNLPVLAVLTLASGYGCGQAPNGLFTTPNSAGSGAASAAGMQQGSSGSSSIGVGGSVANNGGSGSVANGGGGSAASAGASANTGGTGGGASTGGSPSAGAPSAGAPSSGGAGSGGMPSNSGGSGGGPQPSKCDSRLVKPPLLVTDFEQGVAGWSGYISGAAAPVTSIEPGAAMTEHAANFSGGAAKISGMYFPMPCRDVSGYDGISFWGRSEGPASIRFLAVIPQTDPATDIGDCNSMLMTCSDHPGKPFTFGSQWVLYHAAWSELKQLGFGAKASFAGVVNALLWINDGQVQHFDFSIDEVTFYKGDPPTP